MPHLALTCHGATGDSPRRREAYLQPLVLPRPLQWDGCIETARWVGHHQDIFNDVFNETHLHPLGTCPWGWIAGPVDPARGRLWPHLRRCLRTQRFPPFNLNDHPSTGPAGISLAGLYHTKSRLGRKGMTVHLVLLAVATYFHPSPRPISSTTRPPSPVFPILPAYLALGRPPRAAIDSAYSTTQHRNSNTAHHPAASSASAYSSSPPMPAPGNWPSSCPLATSPLTAAPLV
ncbi:hypothetical protein BDY17DRAFT_139521 [Neohortaea acidophila]|uniref:Uncharacterized protein n=1 Tax=Neohortaea acidophila TaxID=245834 RepID=A0A6A6PTJ5_9PEZI|nr:uncharacterized protein BDY17DRAFT_139521 [Neohortaea acidophila]KAF2483004.1 hypothetical protein BDY17DRAFT_139521 [Neohortaea acidophila]